MGVNEFAIDGWSENANADNAIATATHAAEVAKKHVIRTVAASFSGTTAVTALLEIKIGATVVWSQQIWNSREFTFPAGMFKSVDNELVQAVLAASGTAATFGFVSIGGQTP